MNNFQSKIFKNLVLEKEGVEKEATECQKIHNELKLADFSFYKNIPLTSDFTETAEEETDFYTGSGFYFDKKNMSVVHQMPQGRADSKLNHFVHSKNSPLTQEVKEKLNLKSCQVQRNRQLPGRVTYTHFDICSNFTLKTVEKEYENFTTTDLKKFIIFLDDWQFGQIFMFPNDNLIKWKKFDVYSFPWYVLHSTANCSDAYKDLLIVTGV